MKKIIIIAILFTMLPIGSLACNEVILPQQEAQSCLWSDASYWAITEDHFVAGIKSPGESVQRLPAQSVQNMGVRGFTENGLIRSQSLVRIIYEQCTVIGLKQLTNVSVFIDPQYYGIVSEIVSRRLGEGVLMCAQSIIASTLWRVDEYIGHIFFASDTNRFAVGHVTMNGGKNSTFLYAGDFDGNGTLELGFAPGWSVRTASAATEQTIVIQNTYINNKTCKKTINLIVQDNRQININSNVINNQKQIVVFNNASKNCQTKYPCQAE